MPLLHGTRPPLPRTAPRSPAALAEIAQVLATRDALWRPVVHFDPHDRWYTRVAGGEGWEAWLLTWTPGQTTALHGHGRSAGAFTVLQGVLTETEALDAPVIGQPLRTRRHVLTMGQHRAFATGYVHEVANAGVENAVSLHVYGPALTSMTRYALDREGLLRETADERVGADW